MKKGEISLEALVKFIPHLILTIALLSILATFVYYLLYPPLTEPQKDFKRLTKDIQDIIDAKTDHLELKSPMQANEWYYLEVFPKNYPALPPKCLKQACVCLTEQKDKELYQTCKQYPSIVECKQNAPCGQLCIPEWKQINLDVGTPTSIQIKKECNKVTIG